MLHQNTVTDDYKIFNTNDSFAFSCERLGTTDYIEKNDESGKKGYKSIVFYKKVGTNADGSARKERKKFDIQANNPFNMLPYKVERTTNRGVKVYSLSEDDLDGDLRRYQGAGEIKMSSGYALSNLNGEGFAIGYNLFPTSGC